MLTIGQLAAAAGISTRAVRHYHRIGLLPERTRRSNGYREYDITDLLLLLRIRRLTGLGVSLSDCAVALTSPTDSDLRELLVELDQELAIQESEIGSRRLAISQLLGSPHDPSMADEVSELVTHLRLTLAQVRSVEQSSAATEIESTEDDRAIDAEAALLEMLQAAVPADQFAEITAQYRDMLSDKTAVTDGMELNRRFEKLVEIDIRRESTGAKSGFSDREMFAISSIAAAISKLAKTFSPANSAAPPQQGHSGVVGEAAWAGFGQTLSPAQLLCVQLVRKAIES